ncbi:site-specific integrase [Glaciihabitans sp. INWT7]|uniref:tyrosine-type recombinase/integrase n=1 Tax=Glaciihabitans sp. INWT7 TaxID=2596912 RepID=UPI0016279985|nr:site-specific integrase [Glaciihabitans sp. INWT7]QNE45862.1 site-specific integrase [Glaciihabitans sp. INWT7]
MSKRANGEGSIYQRKDGRWTAATYVLTLDGGRRRRQIYGATRKAVSQQLGELNSKTDRGIPAAVDSWTVETYASHWLEEIAPTALRPSTRANYAWVMRKYIVPLLGRNKLRSLRPDHVRKLHGEVLELSSSPSTVQLAHAVLRSMLSEAMREQYVDRNVALLTRPTRIEKVDVVPWSAEEATTFLDSVDGHPFAGLFTLALALGMRRGELLGLRWQDVDLDEHKLHVRQTVQRLGRGEGLVMGPPKTARSRRSIPLPQLCVDALIARHRVQDEDRRIIREGWTELDLVFTTTIGTVIEPSNLRRSFNRAIELAGLRQIRFHDLRHTCASLLLAQGVPMRVVMEILGHSTMSITSDLYTHVSPNATASAVSAVSALLVPSETETK